MDIVVVGLLFFLHKRKSDLREVTLQLVSNDQVNSHECNYNFIRNSKYFGVSVRPLGDHPVTEIWISSNYK